MKKTDDLVKKVAFFEKLAVYGNRSTFLKALGQAAGLTPDQKQRLDSVMRDLAVFPGGQKVITQLQPFFDGTSTDTVQLHQLLLDASRLIPLTNAPQAHKALELANMFGPTAQAPAPTDETMMMPDDKIRALPTISQDQQEALSRVVTVRGIGLPLKIDGKLGKETRKALDAFKKYLTEKSTDKKSYTDQEALDMAVTVAGGSL